MGARHGCLVGGALDRHCCLVGCPASTGHEYMFVERCCLARRRPRLLSGVFRLSPVIRHRVKSSSVRALVPMCVFSAAPRRLSVVRLLTRSANRGALKAPADQLRCYSRGPPAPSRRTVQNRRSRSSPCLLCHSRLACALCRSCSLDAMGCECHTVCFGSVFGARLS